MVGWKRPFRPMISNGVKSALVPGNRRKDKRCAYYWGEGGGWLFRK